MLAVAVMLSCFQGCNGYVPGAQAYWDHKVQELCAKDGGVAIFGRVNVSKADIERRRLPTLADGRIDVSFRGSAHPEAPAYAERKVTLIREGNPTVSRLEVVITLSLIHI